MLLLSLNINSTNGLNWTLQGYQWSFIPNLIFFQTPEVFFLFVCFCFCFFFLVCFLFLFCFVLFLFVCLFVFFFFHIQRGMHCNNLPIQQLSQKQHIFLEKQRDNSQGRSQPLTPDWARQGHFINFSSFSCRFSHFTSKFAHFLSHFGLPVCDSPTREGPGYATDNSLLLGINYRRR